MTKTEVQNRISRLNGNPDLSHEDRVAGLMQIYLDARAVQRAANEGGMINPDGATSADDVAFASEALRAHGVDASAIESEGANTL